MANRMIDVVEKAYLKKEIPQFEVGDTVDVATRIIEGDKERIQVFSGTVIARKGRGVNEILTVRRSGESRRAKLYYLRQRVGKAVRLTEKRKDKRDEAQPGVGGGEKTKESSAKESPA